MLTDPSFPKGFLSLWVKTNETGLPGQWQREGNSPPSVFGRRETVIRRGAPRGAAAHTRK